MNQLTDTQKAFLERYDNGLQGLDFVSPGFCSGCQECLDGHDICCEHKALYMLDKGEIVDEGHFSWSACDACGGGLGGDRYAAHGVTANREIIHFEICQDCLLYMANGDLPD